MLIMIVIYFYITNVDWFRDEFDLHLKAEGCIGFGKVVNPCLICGMYLSGKLAHRKHLTMHSETSKSK